MPIILGSTPIQAMKLGTDDILAAYIGSDLVWSKTSIYHTFDGPNTGTLESLGFVHYGGASYKIGVTNGVIRVQMPDGTSLLGEFIDRVRYDAAVAPTDDGYIQFRVGSVGSGSTPSVGSYATDVFGRGSNGGVTHGAGVRLVNSSLSLVRRVASSDSTLPAGSFAAGDIIRLDFVGNLYTLRRNGELQLEWEDTGSTVSVGPGFRSLIMRMTGGRELLGSRRFSPAIDYVEYG